MGVKTKYIANSLPLGTLVHQRTVLTQHEEELDSPKRDGTGYRARAAEEKKRNSCRWEELREKAWNKRDRAQNYCSVGWAGRDRKCPGFRPSLEKQQKQMVGNIQEVLYTALKARQVNRK